MPAPTRRRTGGVPLVALLASLPLAVGCAGSGGAAPAPAPEPDPAEAFVGDWSGTFVASQFSGLMTLELRRAEGAWTGLTEVSVDMDSMQAAVEDIAIEGTSISFSFFMGGGDVTGTGVLANGELTGSLEVYVDGSQVDSATFRLTKGSNAGDTERAGGIPWH